VKKSYTLEREKRKIYDFEALDAKHFAVSTACLGILNREKKVAKNIWLPIG
jgi:hypothetical protein